MLTLNKGDVLLMYTDGVTEAGVMEPMYIDGLEQYLATNCNTSAEAGALGAG